MSQDNSRIINLKSWGPNKTQTFPPTQSILKHYPTDESLPLGKIVPYGGKHAKRF